MAIFHCYVSSPEGNPLINKHLFSPASTMTRVRQVDHRFRFVPGPDWLMKPWGDTPPNKKRAVVYGDDSSRLDIDDI